MSKPEVIGRPHKIAVRISWTDASGEKHSKGFEVYGILPRLAEGAVLEALTDLSDIADPGNPVSGEES